ncbi:receptor activity-modifying protein 2 isoform X1 [Salarias fasciatus]|nr:receptor activity-modifying protein 2 isoform X1 [Salarias fasciatus]
MTVTRLSLLLSGCFVTLLIWGCSSADGLVNEKVTEQPATTVGYHSTGMMDHDVGGGSALSFACGNISHNCMDYCTFCADLYAGPTMDCLSTLFEHLCLKKFETAMAPLNSTDWCTWKKVNGLYNNLSLCTEETSDCLLIPWPSPLVEQTFVDIHSRFFKDCPSEELSDPPPAVVFALVITPICLIPVMVSLVVFKTKDGDGSS